MRSWTRREFMTRSVAGAMAAWACPGRARGSDVLNVDVIVTGTDPEGIAAAVSCARGGLRTLLVDGRLRLGGLWTCGGLNFLDLNRDPGGRILNGGLFAEFHRALARYNPDGRASAAFDVTAAETYFRRLVAQHESLVVKLGVTDMAVLKEGDRVTGVRLTTARETLEVSAQRLIDATQDARVAARAGASYTLGMEDINLPGRWQPATLVFQVGSVDWERLREHVMARRRGPGLGADHRAIYGFQREMDGYQPQSERVAVRGLNLGRLDSGRLLVNTLLLCGFDPLDWEQREAARATALTELPGLVDFLRRKIVGFGRAELIGPCDELYVRESRHLVSHYRLTVNDVLGNRDFGDAIAQGCYPIDIQRTGQSDTGWVIGRPAGYGVPFRCLVPKGVEHLLVVGRAAGYDSLAHGSARVVPLGVAAGEAAGVACAVSVRRGLPFAELAREPLLGELQDALERRGVRLRGRRRDDPLAGSWSADGVRLLRGLGLLCGGYHNDYQLESTVTGPRFAFLAGETERRLFLPPPGGRPERLAGDISGTRAVAYLLSRLGPPVAADKACEEAVRHGLLTATTTARVARTARLNRALAGRLLADYITYRRRTGARPEVPSPHRDESGASEPHC